MEIRLGIGIGSGWVVHRPGRGGAGSSGIPVRNEMRAGREGGCERKRWPSCPCERKATGGKGVSYPVGESLVECWMMNGWIGGWVFSTD